MKFLHLSDLHLGRRLHDVSLLEDQRYILNQILELLDSHGADAVVIAGDVYDKAVPSAEAVRLFDWFLTELVERQLSVLLVSGNHDSAERLAFGSRIMDSRRVYVSPVFDRITEPVVLSDAFGEVCFYLLPFVKPVHVRKVFPDAEIATYTDAVQTVVAGWAPDETKRNVLIAHQFVTGAERSESEVISIGGLDDVSCNVFQPFDYTALGHLHRAQQAGKECVRYSGTPLAYSFSEGNQEKNVTWVELEEKGSLRITMDVLKPLHCVRTIRGVFSTLLEDTSEDYLRIILTDEEDVPNALSRLRYRYPNLLRLEYDNIRSRLYAMDDPVESEQLTPMQLLEGFYSARNGMPMDDQQRAMAQAWMEEIWEGDG